METDKKDEIEQLSASASASASLTERMRSATRSVHDKSDRLVNLKLALVLTSRRLYGESIALFAEIYDRLEVILERQKDHPQLGQFQELLPFLQRSEGFEADVSFYLTTEQLEEMKSVRYGMNTCRKVDINIDTDTDIDGDRKEKVVVNPPHLMEYLDRLDTLEREDPIRLVAYIYHMYMAIFAGGYIIQKLVKKSMRLQKDSDDGVRAFCMNMNVNVNKTLTSDGNIVPMNGKQIRTEMKRIMNEVIAPSLNEDEIEGILDESHHVFRRNNDVVASVKDTAAFTSASDRCRNLVLIPTAIALVGIFMSVSMSTVFRRT